MKHLTTFRLIDEVARLGSIRRAAEAMAITASAVQRRLIAFEEELGEPIFERLPHGVRLNAAGELAIHHVRQQLAETDRLRSRLADLTGVRRGHVSVACSQALTPYFLPEEIGRYSALYPAVRFEVMVQEHGAASGALEAYLVDLALVFDAAGPPPFEILIAVPQPIRAMMAADHPLAGRGELRLRECLEYPLALPTRAFGGRMLIERSLAARGFSATPELESNSFEYLKAHVARSRTIAFQIDVGAPRAGAGEGVTSVPVAARDVHAGSLYFGQLKGRTLSVAAARFADQVTRRLEERFGMG
ncbi:LysR family transcriptional regulator [Albimonas pacifica]|uniref:DNA-binding transcriptional regulator, LysR family n=1 Tax=Albimonas pacifica TaxID=1114924 RepID=A0A1I3BUK0_9RHOB|nr:LysR family transcriptional regulator [Albimonas pacifica]SFH65984.1 DNA-binding transcriptional regulator, LysR family [Albimonas pacifica]